MRKPVTIAPGTLPTLNQWFLSLEPGRQAILREDKWMLADNAYQAGKEEGVKEAFAEVLQMCQDFSSREGNVYIKDVEAMLEALQARCLEEDTVSVQFG